MNPLFRGRLLALCAPIFWSVTGIVVRLLENADSWQVNVYRSGSLALFVFGYLFFRYRLGLFRYFLVWGLKPILGGLCVGLAMFCNIVAIEHTTVANATLMMAAGPIVAAIAGSWFLQEHVSGLTWLAIGIAIVGIAIMVGGNPLEGGVYGDLIALVGMLGFGAYAVVLRTGKHMDMTSAVFYAGIFSATAAGLVATLFGAGLVISLNDALWCIFLGIVQLGLGSILFAIASSVVPAVELTLFALGEPILAPIWVWVGVGEIPATSTFIGGGTLMMALLVHLFQPTRS
ncbi:MAG: DME family drug/metabolite transporter [Parasphingorhabdus sp.]|jgi:DME family drug/metabolite transporter